MFLWMGQVREEERGFEEAARGIERDIHTLRQIAVIDSQITAVKNMLLSSGGDTALAIPIYRAHIRHEQGPDLIIVVISTESSYRRNAVSEAGALGLMQIMPLPQSCFCHCWERPVTTPLILRTTLISGRFIFPALCGNMVATCPWPWPITLAGPRGQEATGRRIGTGFQGRPGTYRRCQGVTGSLISCKRVYMKEIARIRYAEEAPYWKTSRTAAEDWVEKAKRVIVGAGGRVLADMVLNVEGKTTYVIKFAMAIDGQEREYRIDWPVLKSRAGDERAAKVQAATVLYHV